MACDCDCWGVFRKALGEAIRETLDSFSAVIVDWDEEFVDLVESNLGDTAAEPIQDRE